jgi:MATE family multidrug resistance protein
MQPLNSFVKRIWNLSWPIILGQISYVLMGIADNIMVSKVSSAAVAAVGFSNTIFFTVSIIGIGILSIIPPLISKSKAQNDFIKCGQLLNNGILIAIWMGAIFTILSFLLASHFNWFKQDLAVEIISSDFLRVIGYSAIPLFIFLAAKQFTDGLGFTMESMYIALGSVLLNIILNYILIYGHFGAPEMGAQGAAWATFISRVAMALGMLIFIFKSRKIAPYRPKNIFSNNSIFQREILKDGVPSGLQYFFEIGAFAVANLFMGWMGKDVSAAYQIVISPAALTYLFVSGFGIGASILVSESLGENNKINAYKFGLNAIKMTLVFELITCTLFIVFHKVIPLAYIQDENVLQYAIPLMLIAGVFQIPDGIQCVCLGVLRGMYDVKIPTLFTLIAYWVVSLPLGYYLAFIKGYGAQGVWWGLTIGLLTSSILLSLRFFYIAKPANN